MARAATVYTIALIAIFASVLASPAFATFWLLGPGGAGLGGVEGNECLASLRGVSGCIQEVISAFMKAEIRVLGPQCCKASLNVDDNCWPKVFPLNPFFPPLIKKYCEDHEDPDDQDYPSSSTTHYHHNHLG